jgi:hypothetical protein
VVQGRRKSEHKKKKVDNEKNKLKMQANKGIISSKVPSLQGDPGELLESTPCLKSFVPVGSKNSGLFCST